MYGFGTYGTATYGGLNEDYIETTENEEAADQEESGTFGEVGAEE
jgi:hypothetical protein